MSNLAKRIFAIASPVIVLVISVSIFARYSEEAGPDLLIAAVIIAPLFLSAIISVIYQLVSRSAAVRAAAALNRTSPGSRPMLTEFGGRATKTLKRMSASLGEGFKPGLLIAVIEPDRVSFFRPRDLGHVATLRVGIDIERYYATTINRSTPFNEPCLRLVFADGTEVDAMLFEASRGKWPHDEDLVTITSDA